MVILSNEAILSYICLFLAGYIFNQTEDSLGRPANRLVAECAKNAVNASLPGWVWAPLNMDTGERDSEYLDFGVLIPECSKYGCMLYAYWYYIHFRMPI